MTEPLPDAVIRELAHKHLKGRGDQDILDFAKAVRNYSPSWQIIPEGPAKRLTDMKTKSIVDSGYSVVGYVLANNEEPSKMCISYGSAIKWVNADQMFHIMHNLVFL